MEFEKLLTKEILDSLNKHPEKWKSSIVGIQREDGLNLLLGTFEEFSNVSVHSPYKYDFVDLENKKQIFKLSRTLLELQEKQKNKLETLGSEKKLAEFLNLDTRKNKLDHLNELNTEIEIEKEIEIDKKVNSISKSIFNIFKFKI